jgi:hypothetical protein
MFRGSQTQGGHFPRYTNPNRGGQVHEKNRLKNDMNHGNQDKERNPMGEVPNEGVGKGSWVHGKNRLKNGRYHCNQDKERNPMLEVPNKGVGGTTILSFLLQSYTLI